VPHVPHLSKWQRLLAETQGQAQAAHIAGAARRRYQGLRAAPQPSASAAQAARLRRLIWPGLALYQALGEVGLEQGERLAEVERLFEATLFTNERRFTALLNRLPDPFPVVRWLLRRVEQASHAEADQVLVADTADCFAFNGRRCFILEALRFYQAPELTPLYCLADDWLAEAMPKVAWRRTQTLGRGDAVCDFRWERREPPSP
jgi:hypothetical protein